MASKNQGGTSVKRFAQCAVAMRNMFYDDGALTEAECHFMDNHFQVLEMAYLRWKQKRTRLLTAAPASTGTSKAA
ncbi:MAG TPA: hypothetical protein VL261_02395 [Nitrospira sp.]|jgi:hypothetical protein|nr:hypothetical protein [Nitrospira sp.]